MIHRTLVLTATTAILVGCASVAPTAPTAEASPEPAAPVRQPDTSSPESAPAPSPKSAPASRASTTPSAPPRAPAEPAPYEPAPERRFDTRATLRFLDRRFSTTAKIASKLWGWAEVGFQEKRSSKLLQDTLKKAGFKIRAAVAGMPTAFVATYGQGSPTIAILAEFDALPGINQAARPVRAKVTGKRAGHACGHNLFGAGSVQAAIGVKEWMARNKVTGQIRVFGTPAEEGGSGKVYMVRAGLFDDVDATLHWHPADENSAKARTSLANRSAKFRFYGVSAHAAGAPHRARSALDGVEAFNHMVNLLREHVPQQTRIHYVITEGGKAPNVVPDFAEVFYYVRHPRADELRKIWSRVEEAAKGAAQGTGTRVEWEIIHGNHPLMINEALAHMVDRKLRRIGGILYSRKEEAFAKDLYASFDAPRKEIGDQLNIEAYGVSLGYGSTDVGDVSIATPTVGFTIATWVPGTSAHSWQAVAASGQSIGFKGAHNAAKVLALAAIELFDNPALRAAAKNELDRRRGKDFEYVPLLGDRKPPLDYRK